jgi:hypothetical protein
MLTADEVDLAEWDGVLIPERIRNRGLVTLSLYESLRGYTPQRPGAYLRISFDRFGHEKGVTRQLDDADWKGTSLGWGPFAKIYRAQPGQLGGLFAWSRPHCRGPPVDEGRHGPGVAGFTPLDDVGMVQPLPAQDRAFLAGGGGVVLRDDPQLELGGEAPTRRLGRRVSRVGYRGFGAGHAGWISCRVLQG